MLIALSILLPQWSAQAADLPVVEAARASGALSIDGALSEADWPCPGSRQLDRPQGRVCL